MPPVPILTAEIHGDPTTAVVAGHYQVVWCPHRRNLIPVLSSVKLDAHHPPPPQYKALLQARGSFPEETLRIGTELCRSTGAQLLVLVDDVYFRRADSSLTGDELAAARASMRASGLPSSYHEYVDGTTLIQDTLPAGNSALVFTESRLNRQYSSVSLAATGIACDANTLTCSDTAVQLLVTIGALGFKKAVLFLPRECASRVESAISLVVPKVLDEVTGVWCHLDETQTLVFETFRFT